VNTSLHGVGHQYAAKAFRAFGFPPFTPVERQQDPDPDFPTVNFPNPEEKGCYLILASIDPLVQLQLTGSLVRGIDEM